MKCHLAVAFLQPVLFPSNVGEAFWPHHRYSNSYIPLACCVFAEAVHPVHLHTHILCVYSNINMCACLELICMHVWHPCVAVMIDGRVDPFHRWGVLAFKETTSLYVLLCLTHVDWLSWSCRPLISQADLSKGAKVTLQNQACHVLCPNLLWSRDMLSNDNGIFQLCPDLAEEMCFVNILKETLITWNCLWQLICQRPSTVLLKWWGHVHSLSPPIVGCYWFPLCVTGPRPDEQRGDIFSRNGAASALHFPYLLLLNI